MVALPEKENTTLRLIEAVDEGGADDFRAHLGASQVGAECDRALWYGFRWVTERVIEPRIKRLFRRGDREEAVLVDLLRRAGIEAHEADENGEQFRVSAVGGHFGGSMDGAALGLPEAPKTWHVLEFKTHNDKSFKKLQKEGVELSKPQHYAQMQIYMHLSEMERAYYLAVNKNDDQLYGERVRYSKRDAEKLLERARSIIEASEPSAGISTDASFYLCKWCDHRDVCYGNKIPVPTCRSCAHATPRTVEGGWFCERHRKVLSVEDQLAGCKTHLYIPPLLSWAEVVDATPETVRYRSKATGAEFENGEAFPSVELYQLPPALVTNDTLQEIVSTFGATVQGVSNG